MAAPANTPAVPPTPTALAPLSPAQIRSQATSTVTKAYAPAYTDINQQSKRAQGISQKRTADNKFYLQWLDSKMAELQSHQDAANQQLIGMQQSLQHQQDYAFGNQQQSLVNEANQRAGNVSNNQGSTDFGNRLGQDQALNSGLLADSRQQALTGVGTNVSSFGAARANNFNVMAASQTKQIGDLDTLLGKLSDARTKLDVSKTGDIAKEIARLQGVEIQKVQSNRDFGAAVAKLQLSAKQLDSLNAYRAASLKIQQQNADTALTKAQQSQANSDRNYQLNVQKYNTSVANDIYLRDHGLGKYRPNKSGTKPPLTQSSQNAIYSHISKIQGLLNDAISNGNMTAQQAWHFLHTGGYLSTPAASNGGKPGKRYVSPVGDTGLLNAAFNTLAGGTGLSPGDLSYLAGLGLTNPGSRLSVNHNSKSNAGHGAVS